jgi:hypothetical protein
VSTEKRDLNREYKFLKLISYKNGDTLYEFPLTDKKVMIGSSEHADIHLADPHISKYHAFLLLDDDGGGKITDLSSTNGVYLNGKKVSGGYFTSGDRLELANIEFHVEEFIPDNDTSFLNDIDANILKVDEVSLSFKVSEPPPLEGMKVIDGEYCDIYFKEDNLVHLDHQPLVNSVDPGLNLNFIDPTEDTNILPISRERNELCLQVITLTNGHVLSYEHLPIKDKTYYISSREKSKDSIMLFSYQEEEDFPFLTIEQGKIYVSPLIDHECQISNNEGIQNIDASNKENTRIFLENSDLFIFTKGSNQLMVKMTDAPPHLRVAPFFGRDSAFQKQAGKVFSAIMSIFLLLLLIEVEEIKEPVETISVVYRKNLPKQHFTKEPAASENHSEQTKGDRKEDKKKDKMMAASKSESESTSTEAASPMPTDKTVANEKIKQYEFSLNNNLNSLFGKSDSSVTQVKKATRSVAAINGLSGAKAASTGSLKASGNVDVGSLGSDLGGKYDKSSGIKGYAEKKGIDTTYIDPRTVVLGSMDPELLRKILQEYLPQFRHCYQQELQYKNDEAEGVVDMNFRIEESGRVSKVDILTQNGKFSPKGIDCMAGVLRLIDFPKPKGGGLVDVRQPLNFFSEQSKI